MQNDSFGIHCQNSTYILMKFNAAGIGHFNVSVNVPGISFKFDYMVCVVH